METTTILITGVGGPQGQAILKAARRSALPCRILGTDRMELSAGLWWVDRPFVTPCVSQAKAYCAALGRICDQERPRLILPGSDGELRLLARIADRLQQQYGATVVTAPAEALCIGMDKWHTASFLEREGFAFPETVRLEEAEAVEPLIGRRGFPLIAKPCVGAGSSLLFKIVSHAALDYVKRLPVPMVLQEYLHPDDQEYTVAVYTAQDGAIAGSIAFRRELVAGNTYRAWVSHEPSIHREAAAIARALKMVGPCNVQLRLTGRGPVAFEINPRFSTSTAMRAHFGYNEVEMCLRDYVFQEPIPPPRVTDGIALRFWEELYLDEDGVRQAFLPASLPVATR
jgi:carbamoyl-phosphate synthase large subunit